MRSETSDSSPSTPTTWPSRSSGATARRDREDVLHLADAVPFDLETLRARYQEMRPYLGNPEREDLTLKLWIEAIEEKRKGHS